MSKKLLRSIFAVFLAVFMFGTSVNPAVYATGQEEETAEQKDPNETAVQEAPAESLTLGQTPDGSTDADEAAEKEVIRSFVLNDIPESVQSAGDLPETLSAELEGEEADNVKVDVEWNEVTENDAVCFVPSLTEESEKSYTLSADAKSALKNVKVEKAAVAEEVKEPAEVKEPETKTDEVKEASESKETKEGKEEKEPAEAAGPAETKEQTAVAPEAEKQQTEALQKNAAETVNLLNAPSNETTTISEVTLDVTVPVEDEAITTPSVSKTDDASYSITYNKWIRAGGEEYLDDGTYHFYANDEYYIKTILTPNDGCVFSDDVKVTPSNGEARDTAIADDGTLSFVIAVRAAEREIVDPITSVHMKVTVPAAGTQVKDAKYMMNQFEILDQNPRYEFPQEVSSGYIGWYEGDVQMNDTQAFISGRTYRMEIKLFSKTGSDFPRNISEVTAIVDNGEVTIKSRGKDQGHSVLYLSVNVTIPAKYKLSVETPPVGAEIHNYMPHVNEVENDKSVSVMSWVPAEKDVIEEQKYGAGLGYETFDVISSGTFQPGVPYYAVAAVIFEEGEVVLPNAVELLQNDYVKQIGSPILSTDKKRVFIAFSVTIPSITVTVEFGSAHSAFAQIVASASETTPMTVTGSTLTYKALKGGRMWFDITSPIRGALLTAVDSNPFIDNGEMYENYHCINMKPMDEYDNVDDWNADYDIIDDGDNQEEDVTLYIQWEKPTGAAIKVTPPVCGTEVKTVITETHMEQTPTPEVSIISGKVEKHEDYPPIWFKNGTIEYLNETIKGGEKYSVGMMSHIAPVFGYYINEDEFTVEGGTLSERSYVTQGMILINNVTAEHVPGEWEVKEEPSVGKEGTEVRKCSGCGKELESRPIPAITYSVKAGDGQTWTKGSGVTADFEFTRSYEDTAFERFTEVVIDGKKVTDFTKEKGSVITKISAAYMETLPVGGHTITAKFNDGGSASATFTVKDKAPEPKPAPAPSNGGGSSKKPTKPIDNVVTCQMAGYPANYSWNEAAKACQPGYIDAGGNFHPYRTVVRKVPNTADRDIMIHAWIAMLSITIGLFCGVKLLHEDWEV